LTIDRWAWTAGSWLTDWLTDCATPLNRSIRRQVREAIMRGDVQAALAGIERIDGKVTGALNQAQSCPVQSRGGWHGVNLLTPVDSFIIDFHHCTNPQLLARDGRLAFTLRLQHLLELVRQV